MKRALSPAETPQVGRSLPRLESWLKVTGRAEYVHNLRLPGMLYGRIFRSSVAHGRIRRLDVSAAQAVGGVHRVVIAADLKEIVPDPYYGPAFHDQPVLAVDKVRYVGEPVAQALAAADRVFEHRFRTQQVMHTPLEPLVSVAESTDSSLTIHTASQSPSFVRIEVARLLGWPENRIRVRVPFLGGGFGAKLYIKLEALVAVLSLLSRRAVKISLTMEEQFFTITKHASSFRIKSGVTRDGRICARECEVWWNGGAYADIGPRVTQKSGFTRGPMSA